MTESLDFSVVFSEVRDRTKRGPERPGADGLPGLPKTKVTGVLGPEALSRVIDGPMSPQEIETLAIEAGHKICPISSAGCKIEANFGEPPEEPNELAVFCEGPCIFDDKGNLRNVPIRALRAAAEHLREEI